MTKIEQKNTGGDLVMNGCFCDRIGRNFDVFAKIDGQNPHLWGKMGILCKSEQDYRRKNEKTAAENANEISSLSYRCP